MLSKIYVFISQVNHKKKKVLPILYCLFICSQNNRKYHWCRGSWCRVGKQGGQDIILRKNGMGNATSALVDKDFVSIISNKTRHYKMAARAVHSYEPTLPTPPTLFSELVFFLCTVKVSLLSPTLAPTFKYLLRPKFDISGKRCFCCECCCSPNFSCDHFHYSQDQC